MQGRRRPGFEHPWRSMDDAGPVGDRHRHGAVQRHTATHGHATRSIGTLRLRRLEGRSVISLLEYCDHPPGLRLLACGRGPIARPRTRALEASDARYALSAASSRTVPSSEDL